MFKPMQPAVLHWSGGKDSMLALHALVHAKQFDVRYLLSTINASVNRVAMHGVRADLLALQAKYLEQHLLPVALPEMPDMVQYEAIMHTVLMDLAGQGIKHSVFGDIFLADLKAYREKQLKQLGLETVFPLWGKASLAVVRTFIDLGYKAVVVCAKDELADFCGRLIDHSFLDDLPAHIDPCGENGEYHSFVFDGPLFTQAIPIKLGAKIAKTFPGPGQAVQRYWYIDVLAAD